MCNMCKYLTTSTREDGTTSAKCAIITANRDSEDSQIIMAAYQEKSGKAAMPNGECHFFYENQRRNKESLQQTYNDFITKCHRNR